jgi:tRNA1(Val) A37 N6-methylase TrmN6
MTVPSQPAISTDKVLGGQVTVLQLQQGYRVAIDPIFLAAAVPFAASARAPEQILDLGAGNGVVGFCLMARNPDVRVLAVDRDADALARAQTAARLNHVEERFRSAKARIGNSPDFAAFRDFDQVVANPPFLPDQRSDPGKADGRRSSDLEGDTPLADWLLTAAAVLRHKGRLTMIHRADRVAEICSLLRPAFGEVTICPLWPKPGLPAKRILISARKGSRGADHISAGLVLHQDDGSFTYSSERILNGAGFDLARPDIIYDKASNC